MASSSDGQKERRKSLTLFIRTFHLSDDPEKYLHHSNTFVRGVEEWELENVGLVSLTDETPTRLKGIFNLETPTLAWEICRAHDGEMHD